MLADDRRRQGTYTSLAVGERLHDAGARRTRTPTAARPTTATASPARPASYDAGHRAGRPGRRQLPGRPVRRGQLRPVRARRQGGDAALLLRHRPRPGAARLVHRRPGRQGRRQGAVRERLRGRRPDDPRVYNGGCKEDLRTAAAVHRGLALRRRADGLAGRARLPARDARPLRLRLDGRGENDRDADRVRARACCSPTPTRRTATATSAPTTRRRRRRWTRSRSRRATRRTSTTRRSRQRRHRFSDAGAGHVDNYSDPSTRGRAVDLRLQLPELQRHPDGRRATSARRSPGRTTSRRRRLHRARAAARSTTATGAVGEGVPPGAAAGVPDPGAQAGERLCAGVGVRRPRPQRPACVRPHPLRPGARGPLRSIKRSKPHRLPLTLTFRLPEGRAGARRPAQAWQKGRDGSGSGCAGRVARAGRQGLPPVKGAAGQAGLQLRLRATRSHRTTTITLTLPR